MTVRETILAALHARLLAIENRTRHGVVPIFLLVPQVKLAKRLDLARDAERATATIPSAITANWVTAR